MIEKLKMQTSANDWISGFPVGSGRIAAMVSSGKNCDVMTMNHEWLWKGDTEVPREAYKSAEFLPMVRKLLDRDDIYRATGIAGILFGGYGSGSAIKNNMDCYQYAGCLKFEYDRMCSFMKRELDIENAIVSADRTIENANASFEAFCDCINDVLVATWRSDEKFSGKLTYFKDIKQAESFEYDVRDNSLTYKGAFARGMSFAVNVQFVTNGIAVKNDKGWNIENATYIKAYCNVGCAKTALGAEKEAEKYFADLSHYDSIKEAHRRKFARIMQRVDFEIGDSSKHKAFLEERMANIKNGKNDSELYKLIYDYARYLMLSCSITAELPMNLQGKWNCYDEAPWNSDYHYDINLQMCYWIAESAALSECTEVLSDYLIKRIPAARISAKNIYGCRGIYFPLADDVWGQCTPESTYYGVWIGAAPWLAQHLWQHYIYTGDKEYLENTAYKFFKEVAAFYEDYLCEDAGGVLQIMPSQSPENRFKEHERETYGEIDGAMDFRVSICKSSAMDIELANDAFDYAIKSAEILGTDAESILVWKRLKERLPKVKIASDGRIVEWDSEKRRETEIGHRHLSHLYGLYPSEQFTADKGEKLFSAAVKSLYTRLDNTGIKTGWGEMWAACMIARTKDNERFSSHMKRILQNCFTDNLLDLHPNFYPHIDSDVLFQIDGNFGAAAAVTEAIVSYRGDKLYLLYNLPNGWENGHMYGVKIPGGHTVNVEWKNSVVTKLEIEFGFGEELTAAVNGEEFTVRAKQGERIALI